LALKIRTFGDPVLREKSHRIEKIDSDVKELIREMSETLEESPGRIGLAAPQVGILKRLFIYDLGYGLRCLINPDIVCGEGEELSEEGCLSFPGVYVAVPRFEKVRIRCLTQRGQDIVIEAEGFGARILQHEYDHLEGILIVDRCDSEEKKRALKEYQELDIQRTFECG